MEKPAVHVVVSYVPLLTGEAGQTIDTDPDSLDQLVKRIEDSPGDIDGILWSVSPEGDPWPIFIIDNAEAIFNHLVEWAEGSPTVWFNFRMMSRGDDYAMALIPKLERSIERYKMAIELKQGWKIEEPVNYQLLFKALSFSASSQSGETFKAVKSKLKSPVKLGFVDKALFSNIREIPENFDPKQIYWIGPFEIQGDDNDFLASMLPPTKNQKKAARRKQRGK